MEDIDILSDFDLSILLGCDWFNLERFWIICIMEFVDQEILGKKIHPGNSPVLHNNILG